MDREVKITPRENSWRVTYYRDGKRRRKQFKTEIEADAFKDAIERGTVEGLEDCSVLKGLFDYTKRVRWKSKSAAKDLIRNGQQAVAFFGEDKMVATITPKEIRRYREHLGGTGNALATINRKLSALSAMLSEAEELEIIEHKPRVKLRREKPTKLRWVRENEEADILNWMRAAGYETEARFVTFLIHTGLRVTKEGLSLRLSNVRTIRRGGVTRYVLDILGKGAKQRSVPVNRTAEPILLQMMGDAKAAQRERLWPFDYDHFSHVLETAVAECGYPDVTAHTLRHTFGTRATIKGVGLAKLQQVMGHETIVTTRRYVHVDVDQTMEVVDALA